VAPYLDLLEEYLPGFDHAVTSRGGEEGTLAQAAIEDGHRTLVAVGGDGTWSTVADRILSSERDDLVLGVLPAGTGNDFGRNLGIPGKDLEAAVKVLVDGSLLESDVGLLVGSTRHEERGEPSRDRRFFLNVVGFGFDVAVVDAAKGARFLRGELLYKVAAVGQLFRFPGFAATLEDDGGFRLAEPTLMLTITNGEHFGGGFPIAPRASVTDGLLHACHIGNARPLRRMALFDGAGKGRHESAPEVSVRAAPRFHVSFPGPFRFEADGDIYASDGRELTVEVVPGALKVLAPSGA